MPGGTTPEGPVDASVATARPRAFRVWPSTVGAKLMVVVLTFVGIVALTLFVMTFALRLSSSARAYVTGEGHWTRAQKDAVYSLHRYAWTRDEADYRAYEAAMAVILGDRMARDEMEKPVFDRAVAERGFLQGRNDPRDIPGMISLFRDFSSVSHLQRAITFWKQADERAEALRTQAERLHTAIAGGAEASEVNAALAAIVEIDAQVAPLERQFSATLADGARWIDETILRAGIVLTLVLLAASLWVAWRVGQQIRQGVASLVRGASEATGGNLDYRIPLTTHDELGALARNFNEMMGHRREAAAAMEREQESLRALARQTHELALSHATNEAKSQFLAVMSHEIRTPMTGLLGLLELHETGPLSEPQRESVRIMRDSAVTLLRVIDDILDFSKVEAGQLQVEQVPMPLRDTIECAVATMAPGAEMKGLRLTCTVSPNLPDRIVSDPIRLRQVLLNLCGNAIKFTQFGEVSVRVEGRRSSEGHVALYVSVRDTGIGVSADARSRLFKPFSQAESSTTRRYGGTGLGLSICKGLIEAMGGTIGFSSEPGKGSEFWFELDCAIADDVAPEVAPIAIGTVARARSARLLVAEDHPVNRMVIRRQLEKLGFSVDIVDDGRQALECLDTTRYALVYTDLHMPEMDGIALAREIRRRETQGKPRVAVIALTADIMPSTVDRCLTAGVDEVLRKPMTLADHERVLARWIPENAQAA